MSRLTSVGDLLAVDHAGMRMWSFIKGEKSEDGKQIDFKTFLYNWRGSAIVFSFTWTFVAAIAVTIVEWIPGTVTALLLDQKFDTIDDNIEKNGIWLTMAVNLGFSVLYGSIATLACYFGGYGVAGSGLPDLLSYSACGYTIHKDLFSAKVVAWKLLSVSMVVCRNLRWERRAFNFSRCCCSIRGREVLQ